MNENRFSSIVHIATSPQRLWNALTDTEFLRRCWFGCEVTVGAAAGEPFRIERAGVQTDAGEILIYDPPRSLSYTFQNSARGEPPSRVAFTLESNGDGTRLTLVHDEFPPESVVLPSVRGGWPAILSALKSRLEGIEAPFDDVFRAMSERCPTFDPSPSVATVVRTFIVTSPERLWSALTDPRETERYFFGNRIESTWKSGEGVRILRADGTIDVTGIVLRSEPPSFLSYTWQTAPSPELGELPPCWAEFEIEPFGQVCRLTFREFHATPLEEWLLEGGRSGWAAILSGLKTLLESRRPLGRVEVHPPVRPKPDGQ